MLISIDNTLCYKGWLGMRKNLTYLYPFIVASAGLVFAAGESAAFFVSFYSGNDFGYWGFFFANCAAAVLFAALSLAGAAAFVVVRRKSKRGNSAFFSDTGRSCGCRGRMRGRAALFQIGAIRLAVQRQ